MQNHQELKLERKKERKKKPEINNKKKRYKTKQQPMRRSRLKDLNWLSVWAHP